MNANQVQIKTSIQTSLESNTQLSALEIIAIATGSIGNIINIVSDISPYLQGIQVYNYLKHIHGNPPPVKWFFENLLDFKQFSNRLGVVSAVFEGINKFIATGNIVIALVSVGRIMGDNIFGNTHRYAYW